MIHIKYMLINNPEKKMSPKNPKKGLSVYIKTTDLCQDSLECLKDANVKNDD